MLHEREAGQGGIRRGAPPVAVFPRGQVRHVLRKMHLLAFSREGGRYGRRPPRSVGAISSQGRVQLPPVEASSCTRPKGGKEGDRVRHSSGRNRKIGADGCRQLGGKSDGRPSLDPLPCTKSLERRNGCFWLLSKVPVPSPAIKSTPGADHRWGWKAKEPPPRLWSMMGWGRFRQGRGD